MEGERVVTAVGAGAVAVALGGGDAVEKESDYFLYARHIANMIF